MSPPEIATKLGISKEQARYSLQFLVEKAHSVRMLESRDTRGPVQRGRPPRLFVYAGTPVADSEDTASDESEPAEASAVDLRDSERSVVDEAVDVLLQTRRPIVCRPSTLPEKMPSMMEFLGVQKDNLIGQDENGDLWLCVPLKAAMAGV